MQEYIMSTFICSCGNQISINPKKDEYCKFCNRFYPHDKQIRKKCEICGKLNYFRPCFALCCRKCGWYNDVKAYEYPNKKVYLNVVSLNKAKELIFKGKVLKPEFDEFLADMDNYEILMFAYNKKRYEIEYYKEIVYLYCDKQEQQFNSKQEFIKNAKFDGKSLPDVWENVYYVKYQ